MSLAVRRLLVLTALGVVLLVGFSIYTDFAALGAALTRVAPGAVALALLGALVNYVLRFWRWQRYLRLVGAPVARGPSAWVFVAGFSMAVTPGKVGELFKAVLLEDVAGVPAARTAPVVVAERLTDLISLVLLALAGVAAYGVASSMVISATGVVLAGLLVLAWRRLAHACFDLLARPLPRLAPRLRAMYDTLAGLIRPAPLAWGTGLGALAWLAECLGFALIVRGFPGAHVDLGLATLIYAATTVAGALSFLPGGLLVTEASMTLLLVESARGLDEPTALAATLVTRLCTLWFAVSLGAIALASLRRRSSTRLPPSRTDDPI
jgi:uncharacterized membrane protein YbhN (UPF0104 family)